MAALTDVPRVRVRAVAFHERDVTFRMPFRFGVVTLTGAPQIFVKVHIEDQRGASATGVAAEMLAPKWFDKNKDLSNDDNFAQLRGALKVASDLYGAVDRPRTAFDLFALNYQAQIDACAEAGLNPLIACFGPAMLDRAVLDALCRLYEVSFFDAVRGNLPGIMPVDLLPEFAGFDVSAFLAKLVPAATIDARHTVGMVDPIAAADQIDGERLGDGLPETLEEVVATYGHRYFKLKVGGDLPADLARLTAIAAVLDKIAEPYFVTLDGNEQYTDIDGPVALWDAMARTPALERLAKSILFIEQPINRAVALDRAIDGLAARRPVIIDESDATLDAFVLARRRGYTGVSSKACKGVYKSLLNAARCARWNAEQDGHRYFMSAEDLTTQPGVSVQQDLAIATMVGATHVERNGHHYVNGMAGLAAPEQAAFRAAHPDLYASDDGVPHLKIVNGQISLASLSCPGFAAGAEPDWASMARHW